MSFGPCERSKDGHKHEFSFEIESSTSEIVQCISEYELFKGILKYKAIEINDHKVIENIDEYEDLKAFLSIFCIIYDACKKGLTDIVGKKIFADVLNEYDTYVSLTFLAYVIGQNEISKVFPGFYFHIRENMDIEQLSEEYAKGILPVYVSIFKKNICVKLKGSYAWLIDPFENVIIGFTSKKIENYECIKSSITVNRPKIAIFRDWPSITLPCNEIKSVSDEGVIYPEYFSIV